MQKLWLQLCVKHLFNSKVTFVFFFFLLIHSLVPQGTANISHCQRGLLKCSSRAFSHLKIGPEHLVFILVSNPESEVSSLLSLCVQLSERQCTGCPDELKMFFFLVVLVTHLSFLSLPLSLWLFYLVLFPTSWAQVQVLVNVFTVSMLLLRDSRRQ